MPEDVVTLRADGSQYFDVLSRAGVAADRLSGSGERIGAGFLRGDRVVRTATANITQGLLTANSAADAAILTFQSLERVFRLPIGATIGVAAGVAAFAVVSRELNKTREASEKLRRELRQPIDAEIKLDPADIVTRIETVTKATDELRQRQSGFLNQLMHGPITSHLAETMPNPPGADPLLKEIERGEQRISDLATARADNELKIANLKRVENDVGKEAADIAKAELDYERQRAKLIEESISKGGNTLDFYKRLLAAQITLNEATKTGLDALGEKAEKAMLNFGKIVRDFFTGVGSGAFVKDLAQQRLQQQQQQRGKDIVAELQAARDQGIPLGPNAQAILNEADNISKSAGVGVNDLAQLDFTNLEQLSKYDFSGLDALNGLTIAIQ